MMKLVLALAALAQLALGGEFDQAWLHDSLARVHPRLRDRWLVAHGIEARRDLSPVSPDSSFGIRVVGKYGRGTSVEVTGSGDLLALTLGSEVALLDAAGPGAPALLSEIQLGYVPLQSHLLGPLLVTGGGVIELWDVSIPSRPEFRSRIPFDVIDLCAADTFLYFVGADSFRVYSIADPTRPYQLGACRDSGWATSVTGNSVVFVLRNGIGFIDVADPRNPRRVGLYGGTAVSAEARGTICCASFDDGGSPPTVSFEVLDITNPAAPRRLGRLAGAGGHDISIADTLAYLSGWIQGFGIEFAVVSIADSTFPRLLGTCATPGENWGVWGDPLRGRACVADRHWGMQVVDVTDPVHPALDTALLIADGVRDIAVHNGKAYLSCYAAGMKVLDVTDPARPTEVGCYDSLNVVTRSLAATDSFVYAGWRPSPYLRVFDVTDPAHPTLAGACTAVNEADDMVLRDTLLYIAAMRRFWTVNVSRPREPRLVGSCTIGDLTGCGLALWDTLAYINAIPGLWIVSIADPSAPRVIDTAGGRRLNAWGIAVRETLAFIPSFYDTMWIVSVADPTALRYLAGVPLGADNWGYDAVVVEDTLVYVATLNEVILVNVKNPTSPAIVARCPTPYSARRVVYDPPYVYVACNEAGVLILDTVTTGVAEGSPPLPVLNGIRLEPSLTRGSASLRLPPGLREGLARVVVRDVAGRLQPAVGLRSTGSAVTIDIGGLSPGVYFVELLGNPSRAVFRLVRI
jgi:hypothetical protein